MFANSRRNFSPLFLSISILSDITELCNAALDQLFIPDEDPEKYSGPLPPIENVIYQLAMVGLEYIHNEQLIHCDLKPGNVLICVDILNENNTRVLMKWADFGLSKRINERGTCSMTRDFQLVCTRITETNGR